MDAKEEAEEQLEILLKIPKECSKLFDYYKYDEIEWWTALNIAVFDDTDGHKLFFADVEVVKPMEQGMEVKQTYHVAEKKGRQMGTDQYHRTNNSFIALLDSEVKNLAVLDFNYFLKKVKNLEFTQD